MENLSRKRRSHRHSWIAVSLSTVTKTIAPPSLRSSRLRSSEGSTRGRPPPKVSVHPTAIISSNAELGSNISIGPYSIIGDDVILHDDVSVASHCVIEGPSEFGRGCVFYPFVSAGQAPQDLKYKGERSWLRAGERNTFREFTTLQRGTEGGGNLTEIGSDCLIMAQAHIAHDCRIGSHVIFANGATL